MSNYIAVVRAVFGVVKAVSDSKGERILQPGDVIFDDDVLVTSNLSGSKVSTSEGHNIDLNLGDRWQFQQGDFVESTNNKRASENQPSSTIRGFSSGVEIARSPQDPEDDGGFDDISCEWIE